MSVCFGDQSKVLKLKHMKDIESDIRLRFLTTCYLFCLETCPERINSFVHSLNLSQVS